MSQGRCGRAYPAVRATGSRHQVMLARRHGRQGLPWDGPLLSARPCWRHLQRQRDAGAVAPYHAPLFGVPQGQQRRGAPAVTDAWTSNTTPTDVIRTPVDVPRARRHDRPDAVLGCTLEVFTPDLSFDPRPPAVKRTSDSLVVCGIGTLSRRTTASCMGLLSRLTSPSGLAMITSERPFKSFGAGHDMTD